MKFAASARAAVCAALIAGGAVVCAGSVGCVVSETAAPLRGTVVSGPPPAMVVEVRPVAPPSPAHVWVAGYWHWTGAQYTWVPGHWENPPGGARWSAPRYTSRDGNYFYESGRWVPAGPPQPYR